MAEVLLFSGGGEYVDPWHPFAETSAAIAAILRERHHEVTVVDTVQALRDAPRVDLLVVNAGSGGTPHPSDAALLAAVTERVDAGTPLLALHVSSTLLPDHDEWERMIGGRWVRGVTMHPPYGRVRVAIPEVGHPITAGIGDLALDDERYSWLRVASDVTVLAAHEEDGATHPLVWARDARPARVVYDALGHDAASYANPGRRRLLGRSVDWLLGR